MTRSAVYGLSEPAADPYPTRKPGDAPRVSPDDKCGLLNLLQEEREAVQVAGFIITGMGELFVAVFVLFAPQLSRDDGYQARRV